jgi:hypothetical protein
MATAHLKICITVNVKQKLTSNFTIKFSIDPVTQFVSEIAI